MVRRPCSLFCFLSLASQLFTTHGKCFHAFRFHGAAGDFCGGMLSRSQPSCAPSSILGVTLKGHLTSSFKKMCLFSGKILSRIVSRHFPLTRTRTKGRFVFFSSCAGSFGSFTAPRVFHPGGAGGMVLYWESGARDANTPQHLGKERLTFLFHFRLCLCF